MIWLLTLIGVSAGDWWENSVTIDLTSNNYKEYIGTHKHIIVEFFAPYCHWCRVMFHEYEELSKHYNSENSPWKRDDIIIARINAQFNDHLTQHYQIFAYPTIAFIPSNSESIKSYFNAPRFKHNFIQWIEDEIKSLKDPDFDINPQQFDESEFQDQPPEDFSHQQPRSTDPEYYESHKSQEPQEDNSSEEYDNQTEEFMHFEMVIEDVSSHTSEKWRGEFNSIQIELSELKKNSQDDHQEILLTLHSFKSTISDQILQLLTKIDQQQQKLIEIDNNVINRNKIDTTQSRFNITHMFIFLTLGGIFGFVLSVYLVKIRHTKDFNKV
ncbi:hypothetical protein SteCoe_22825 [Stentor coeruleus]|uniref:Thioredoxin domain-containing protein n=1 Tax=Stentor coeruleus TaxID=5963 RepID=A0A1R2BL80_9CILI|nr:hypothetical protein SteCoe_22825 [Stentor coeruleus]